MKLFPPLPWISTLRPLNLGFLALAAWIVSPSQLGSPLFACLLMLMLTGNLHNDLGDFRADAQNRPNTNPFQSKENRRLGILLLLLGFALFLIFLGMVDSNAHVLGLVAVALALWLYNFRLQYFPLLGNAWLAGIMGFCLFLLIHTGPLAFQQKIWAYTAVALVHFARELVKSLQDHAGDAQHKPLRYSLPPVWLYRLLAALSLLGLAALSYLLWRSEKSPVIFGLAFVLPLPFVLFDRNYKRLSFLLKAFMLLGLLVLYLCYVLP
jgi:4-hydroxybenzoate polyprenyltransferase